MALLQIAEPGESAAPHQHRLAVGIDLGTTNSLVATVRSGMAAVLNDEHGRSLLPSVVHYAADAMPEVGFGAQAKQAQDPKNTVSSVKRFMGRARREIAHVESLASDLIDPAAVYKDQVRRDRYLRIYGNICYDTRDQYVNFPWSSEQK